MTSDANPIRSFNELVQCLNRDGVLHQTDNADKTVRIPTQRGSLDSVLLMRWQEQDGVVQFIQGVPLEVPEDKLALAADAVTRLNHALAVPGFDLNHERRLIAYRLYLPIYPRGAVSTTEIQAMFRLAVKTASDFMPVLGRVLSGQVKPEDTVAEAQRDFSGSSGGTGGAPIPPSANMY